MILVDFYSHVDKKRPAAVSQKIFLDILPLAQKILIADKRIRPKQDFLVELSLLGTRAITKLNLRHHKKNKPTDVISLSYFQADPTDGNFAGEIFICLPFARAQAKKIGQSLTDELRFLFVHGLLHVFGYDHMKPDEEQHMLTLTYKILKRHVDSSRRFRA